MAPKVNSSYWHNRHKEWKAKDMERKRTDNEEFERIRGEEVAAGCTVGIGREAELMPCISLWQPWAQFIALGWKTIETRTHSRFASLVGRRIAIHASQTWDKNWQAAAGPWLTGQQIDQVQGNWPRGTIVCTANVDIHRALNNGDSQAALIDCSVTFPIDFDGIPHPRRYGLYLSHLKPTLPPFTQITGKQGIFYIPAALCA